MKRIAAWFGATLTVVVLLFGYHTSTSGRAATPDTVVAGSAGSTAPDSASSDGTTSDGGSSSDGSSSASSSTTGDVAQTRWGPVQVKITTSGTKITAVDVVEYPTENPKDQEINSYAVPELVKETLSAQSANIDMISGATVTSEGYVTSLQSALDKAGL